MIVGVPKETKSSEYRVGMSPSGVRALVDAGHEVRIQREAGQGAGISDAQYSAQGATVVADAQSAWAAHLVVKVKEPTPAEYDFFRDDLTLFTYLHLAADVPLTRALLDRGVTAVAYETVQLADRTLPLLQPMSEVAGRLSVQAGAHCLERNQGGKGLLMGGVAGTRRCRVGVLGAGVVGQQAVRMAVGMGADVTVLDLDRSKLVALDAQYQGRVETWMSSPLQVEELCQASDLVIGAVLVPGGRAPVLVTRGMLRRMEPGSVVVDVAVDQGGCFATTRATSHDAPTFEEEGVIHYCVSNMPGAVPQTSTLALTSVTLPYVLKLANQGAQHAAADDPTLAPGVNCFKGVCTHREVAQAVGVPFRSLDALSSGTLVAHRRAEDF